VKKPILPVKLFIGLLTSKITLVDAIRQKLYLEFDDIDHESELSLFDKTSYYSKEMGSQIYRKFFSFERLIQPDKLADIKNRTGEIEKVFANLKTNTDSTVSIKRPINLDPGYISATQLVLASTKEVGHRIYIGSGIFAEVTLAYQNKRFQSFPWTYPDYREVNYHSFFAKVREKYLDSVKSNLF
jgi:hypothetical protein